MAAKRKQQPQFPAPTVPAEAVPAAELVPPPPLPVRRLMAAHLRERHGVRWFRLDRHVYLGGGGRRGSQRFTWLPAQSSFLCNDCPGEVYWSGDWTEEMLRNAELWEPALQNRLAGLTDPDDRELAVRLHLEGAYARADLERAAEMAYRETVAHSRPTVDARRKQLQQPLLDAYARLGSKAAATKAIFRLQREQPAVWQQLVGRQLSEAAIASYWDQIPKSKQLQAKRRYQRQRDS